MAITNAGTIPRLNTKKIPTDFVPPEVTPVTSPEWVSDLQLTIAKSTVENAVNKVTLTAILAAITALVDAILAADYVATQTVTAHAVLNDLKINYADVDGDADWLGTTVANYICTVKLYVKAVA